MTRAVFFNPTKLRSPHHLLGTVSTVRVPPRDLKLCALRFDYPGRGYAGQGKGRQKVRAIS